MHHYPCIKERQAGIIPSLQPALSITVHGIDNAPAATLGQFLNALWDGDPKQLMQCTAKHLRQRLLAARPAPEQLASLARVLLPAREVFITESSVDGDVAIIMVEAATEIPGAAGCGQIELQREALGWKISRLQYQYS